MGIEQYSLVAHDWLNLEFIINDLASRVIGQELGTGSSPTWAGATLTGKLVVGSQASPVDVTSTRQHGFELHYSGNDYDVTGIRSRAQLVTTDTTATAQGALLQAANNDGINAGVLQGALIEAIGKSTTTAATISTMRGALIGTEWGALDTVTNLKTLHVRGHSRNAAGAGSFGTGYGIYIENEAVGGNGQAYDAGIYFKGTNLSAGNKAFTYGIDFSGGTFSSEEIKLANGSVVGSDSVILQPTIDSTTFFQVKSADGTVIDNVDTVNKRWGFGTATPLANVHIYQDSPSPGQILFQIGTDVDAQRFIVDENGDVTADGDMKPNSLEARNRGVVTNPSISFNQDPNTGLYNIADDILAFTTGGVEKVRILANGNVGYMEPNPETFAEWTHTTPYLTLHNSTHEDTDGGGESRLIFKREDGAGTETACFQFEASHDGAVANDQLGKGIWSVNTGAGLVQALEIGSDLLATFAGVITTDESYQVDDVQVVSNRVIDARCDDAINSGDVTTDGVIDSLRDAMITHGLIAAA